MAHNDIPDKELADLIQRTDESTTAWINGDITRYLTLISHADDYTLMTPYGGEAQRGFDQSEENLAGIASFFAGGEAELEVVESYASGNLVVLVMIERQHGVVGGLPDQEYSLRVTQVYRRDPSGWQLVHRHADGLVKELSFGTFAALARGDLR
jgi:ketosteroid isomerase-like protein